MIVRDVEAREKWALARWSGDAAKAADAKKAVDDLDAQVQAFEGRTGASAGAQ